MRICCIRKRIYDGMNIFTFKYNRYCFYPINSQFRSLQNLVVLKIIRIWKKKLKRYIITKEWFNNVLFGANCFFTKRLTFSLFLNFTISTNRCLQVNFSRTSLCSMTFSRCAGLSECCFSNGVTSFLSGQLMFQCPKPLQ